MARPRTVCALPALLVCLLITLAAGGCRAREPQGAVGNTAAASGPDAGPEPQQTAASRSTAPRILSQPRNVIAHEHDLLVLAVDADALPAPTYQWMKDGAAIRGATSPTYRSANVRPADAGTYRVAVTNAVGSVLSDPAVVVVETTGVAPTITSPPLDLVVTETSPSSLKVVARGTEPLSYRWSKNGRPGLLSTDAELFMSSPSIDDSGTYVVEVSNRFGNAVAICRLTVNPRLRRP